MLYVLMMLRCLRLRKHCAKLYSIPILRVLCILCELHSEMLERIGALAAAYDWLQSARTRTQSVLASRRVQFAFRPLLLLLLLLTRAKMTKFCISSRHFMTYGLR